MISVSILCFNNQATAAAPAAAAATAALYIENDMASLQYINQ